MLIDDNETDNLIAGKIIEISPIPSFVKNFTSARKALDFLELNAGNPDSLPDLIFLDINMPLVNGDQFLMELEALSAYLSKDPRIVLLSSFDRGTHFDHGKGTGRVIQALVKPLLKDDFERVANEFIKTHQKVA